MEERKRVIQVNYGRYQVDFALNSQVITGNEGFCEITGYSQEEIAGGTLRFYDLLPPEDLPVYMQALSESLELHPEVYLEHRIRRKSGEIIYVFCYGSPQEQDGRSLWDIVITDISDIKTMQVRYSETELELETLISNIPGGVAVVEVGDNICVRHATDEFYHMLGFTKESYEQACSGVLGKRIYDPDYPKLLDGVQKTVANRCSLCVQLRVYHANGELMWMDVHGRFLHDEDGKPLIYATLFDITESKRRDEKLRMQTGRYEMIAAHTNEVIFDYDVKMDVMHLPDNIAQSIHQDTVINGFLEKKVLKRIIHPDDYNRLMRELKSCLSVAQKTSVDARTKAFDGEYVWYRIIALSMADDQNQVVHLFGRLFNVDKLKRMKKTIHEDKEIIERLSTTDSVTGLLNRASFREKVSVYMQTADPSKLYALVYSDINDFSYVNDNFGYDSGNTMLYELGALIQNAPNTLFSCRINSDYFLALVVGNTREEIETAIRARDTSFWKRQRKKYPASEIMVSTGICFMDEPDCDITIDMDNANLARRKAKQSKGDPCCVYYDELRITRTREKIIAAELHGAIENRNVELFLQPKFLLDSKQIIGAEALVRWRNPDGSYRMPVEFIEILEKVGYIIELDFFMYEEVLKSLRRWKEQGKQLIPISVNFSRLHNNYANFVDRVVSLARRYEVDSRYIEVEVTESAFASDTNSMASNMARLREEGFSIDIDDFGKGYSSLSFLLGSPVDTVKVDKAFVDGIEVSEKHREYIKQMCMLIKATEKEIIFEGVETQNQADFLCSCGFTKAQGWLLDKAVPVSVFEERYLSESTQICAESVDNAPKT